MRIPGVGPSIAVDLYDPGYRRPEDPRDEEPKRMYVRL